MDIILKDKEKLTEKVLTYKKHKGLSYEALAKEMGIARMTLFKRKEDHNWTIAQAFFIKQKF